MKELIIVGSGSFIGGAGRYFLNTLALQFAPHLRLPIGTISVNFIGCFLIGLLAQLTLQSEIWSSYRLFLVTGILGGFTTFSAFSYETLLLINEDRLDLAGLNIIISIFFCMAAVWCGSWLARSYLQ